MSRKTWGQNFLIKPRFLPEMKVYDHGLSPLPMQKHYWKLILAEYFNSLSDFQIFCCTFTTTLWLSIGKKIFYHIIWAPSSEFVSSSIPSWQISTAHAQPFRGARDLAFCLKVPLDSLLVWAISEGSGETARMRRLAWTFAARIGDNYQIRLTPSK